MEVNISFNLSDKKEYLKYKNITEELSICESFVNLLSLDTNYIKKELIDKIDYNNIASIRSTSKKIYKIAPLLLLDEFNIIDQVDTYSNSAQKIKKINSSIEKLESLLKNTDDFNTSYTMGLKNSLKFLKKKRSIFLKINNNLEQIISNTFNSILAQLSLYQQIIDVCFIDNSSNFFEGFSQLPPLKKFVFYKMFVIKNENFFNNIPSSNISFTFDCSVDEFQNKIDTSKCQRDVYNILFEENISPMYEYHCTSLKQFLEVSFFTSLILNLNIKKCENCNKYFIAYQRSDEKYCNRTSPQDKNKSCKQYANFENWKNNINSNIELKTYRRIYMAKQMQTRRNPDNLILKTNFDNWKIEAQKIRNQYIHGLISKEDFMQWLNQNQ